MNILVIDSVGNKKTVTNTGCVPRVGDYVDFGYTPIQKVKQVVFYPTQQPEWDAFVYCK